MLKQVDYEKAKEIYQNYLKNDFPMAERPPFFVYKRLVKKNLEQVYVYEEEGQEKAYIVLAGEGEYQLITHLAVRKEARGQGIGSKILQELKMQNTNRKGFIIEAESEEMAKNEEELNIIQKRQRFYQKAGCISFPDISYHIAGVSYLLFVLPQTSSNITNEELMQEIENIYKKILGNMNIFKMHLK